MRKTTEARLQARIEALEECAGHLELEWTDDQLERVEGDRLALRLRAEIERIAARIRLEKESAEKT